MTVTPESITTQAAALLAGTETAVSLAERALDQAQALVDLNAFVALDGDTVMAQAEAARARRRRGGQLSKIDGVPIAVKDNYLTRDYPTTACSRAAPGLPNDQDATVVANLRRAGAVIFGKTNMHEWAYGATNSTSSFGPTLNPLDQARITGGSSGGSAAAVAAGIVGAALGSDTGGSVRIPAAACGVYGFKPSYGRASRAGVLALSWSLDAPGLLARELPDFELLLPYLVGQDQADSTTFGAQPLRNVRSVAEPHLLSLCGPGLERSSEVDSAVAAALQQSRLAIATANLPDLSSYFAAWEAIMHSEASTFHQQRLATRPEDFDQVTRAHLEVGRRITAEEYLKAQMIRTAFARLLLNELGVWDALVLPTLPVVAPCHGEDWQEFGGRRVTTQDSMTWFCWIANLAGFPAVTIPLQTAGMPVGLMLMGRPGKDEELLSLAKQVDERLRGDRPQ